MSTLGYSLWIPISRSCSPRSTKRCGLPEFDGCRGCARCPVRGRSLRFADGGDPGAGGAGRIRCGLANVVRPGSGVPGVEQKAGKRGDAGPLCFYRSVLHHLRQRVGSGCAVLSTEPTWSRSERLRNPLRRGRTRARDCAGAVWLLAPTPFTGHRSTGFAGISVLLVGKCGQSGQGAEESATVGR